MATALTAGYIYFIESDGTDNDDWIGDHAGDPDDTDLDPYTEGTEYCKLAVPKGWRIMSHTGSQVTTIGGSLQYSLRQARRWYSGGANGFETTIANANKIDRFIMQDRHTSGDETVFKPYYLICYHGLNSSALCTKFTDHTDTERAYCRVEALKLDRVWTDSQNQLVSCNIQFVSVWK